MSTKIRDMVIAIELALHYDINPQGVLVCLPVEVFATGIKIFDWQIVLGHLIFDDSKVKLQHTFLIH